MTVFLQWMSFDRPGAEKEDASAFAARLDRVAGALKKAGVAKFDLLGVSSAFAPIGGLFPLPEEKKIPAPGGSMFAVEALAKQISDRQNELFYFYSSEQGIIGRSGRAEVVGEWMYKNVGPYLPGSLRRCAVGGRVQLADGNHILPFFTIRVSPSSANAALRQAQVMGLIALCKERWIEGDLTPVVVGDFGFDRESRTLWEMMSTDFDEVTVALGQGGTDHVWVGREASFRGAKGALAVTKVTRLAQLNDGGASLTSHAGISVEADVRTWRSKRTFNASPRARSRGAPGLVATRTSMHLGWSARQTSGEVLTSRTEDGIVWSEPVSTGGHTNHAVALASFDGKLVVAWTEPDGGIHMATSSDDGATFSGKSEIKGASSSDGPALFAHGEALWLAFADKASGKLALMKHKASGGDKKAAITFGDRAELPFSSKHTPSLAWFNDHIWLAWTETDKTSSVSICTSPDGQHWDAAKTSFATHPRRHSAKGPSLLAHGDRLTLAWIGNREANGYAWFAGLYPHLLDEYYRDSFRSFVQWTSTKDGHVWSLERALDERSEHTPAIADFGDRIYVAWTGIDGANLVNVKIANESVI